MADLSIQGRIAFFIPNMNGGGAERVVVNLLRGMRQRGLELDLVLARKTGPYLDQVPEGVRIIDFSKDHCRQVLWFLARYLRQERPALLISHLGRANLAAVIARWLSGSQTPLALVEHNTPSRERVFGTLHVKVLTLMKRLLYHYADALITVSRAAARDLETEIKSKNDRVLTIYNPIIEPSLLFEQLEPSGHLWLDHKTVSVVLAVGRLQKQKNFDLLLDAFRLLRNHRPVRLVILGEGAQRFDLERRLGDLNLRNDVDLPGFVNNPYAYMSKADVLVLSSKYEGFGNVLVEAMACGCPVVATDCPSGPEEILDRGRWGPLLPVGDVHALTEAMIHVLDYPISKEQLKQRSLDFTADRSVEAYLELIQRLTGGKAHRGKR